MKLAELLHAVSRPRALPAIGDAAGLPAIVLGILADGNWAKGVGIAGVVALALSRFIKLVADLNGLGASLRGHNARQDQELEALKKDVAELAPKGATAALLRSRAITGEFEART